MSSCDSRHSDKEYISVDLENEEWKSKYFPEYDKERQIIYYKEQISQDIKGDIAVPFNSKNPSLNDFACQFSYFNYGKDIRLYNGFYEDNFITGLGLINLVYAIENEDDIEIVSKRHSNKYGDWALVNISIGDYFVSDVFMTPLSMKAYKNRDYYNLIFIQFITDDNYMNVLFCGGPKESIIVSNCPDVILLNSKPSILDLPKPKNGLGPFWHQR